MPRRHSTPAGRTDLRPIRLHRRVNAFAEGSVLIEMGRTHVLCTASIEDRVPEFRRGTGEGWVTAEYAMLPRSTHTRTPREGRQGKANSRALEISRLVGRSLRAAVNLAALGERTITVDCDVLQADGGTRCAAITGGMVALVEALRWLQRQKCVRALPLRHLVAAVSVGIVAGQPTLDLCYEEDVAADVDMNVVMTATGRYVEIQGTAEHRPFTERQQRQLLTLARRGIRRLLEVQGCALRLR